MLIKGSLRRNVALSCLAAVLAWSGCEPVRIRVDVPAPPRAPLSVINEIDRCVGNCLFLEDGPRIYQCPHSRGYILRRIEPYFDGLEAMNE